MKKEILALGAGLLLLGGCAQKEMQMNTPEGAIILEQQVGHAVPKSELKAAIEAAAKEKGWMTTPLGDRKVIADKYFSETKNIAAEISITGNGYTVEYSSGQNISDSEAKSQLEALKEAIEKKLEKGSHSEH
ncbi:hypothetical protein [Hydrogenimonas sp.]